MLDLLMGNGKVGSLLGTYQIFLLNLQDVFLDRNKYITNYNSSKTGTPLPDSKQNHEANQDDKSSRRNSSSASSNRYVRTTGPQQQDSLEDVPDINSNNQDVIFFFI